MIMSEVRADLFIDRDGTGVKVEADDTVNGPLVVDPLARAVLESIFDSTDQIETTLLSIATEAKLEAVRFLLESLDFKDFSTETTLTEIRNKNAAIVPFSEIEGNSPFEAPGDFDLHIPITGNAIRLRWYQMHQDPADGSEDNPVASLKVGARTLFKDKFEAGLPTAHGTHYTGGIDEKVTLVLIGTGTVYVNGEVEEFTP